MKANELRIGNYVKYFNENNSKINVIDHNYCHLNDASSIDYTLIRPIPLTEEWLIKFGFEPVFYGYTCYDMEIEKRDDLFYLSINCNEYTEGQAFQYVHQLQNLYFALTGKELTI